MSLSADTPIFVPWERDSLESNQFVHPYTTITKAQLFGLLGALGEYACRQKYLSSSDSELAEMNRTFIEFLGCMGRKRYTIQITSSGQPVFDASERTSIDKYVSSSDLNLNKGELLGLLDALGRYSLKAPRIEQVFGATAGIIRMIHAHNRLLSFHDQPFTLEEFAESVRATVTLFEGRPPTPWLPSSRGS